MEQGNELRVLVVDDNRSAADALVRVLRRTGDVVEARYDGAAAIDRMKEGPLDLVLTDLKMEPVDGMAVLQAARAQRPPIEVIVFTAYGAVDVAVRAMRMGARDFLTKPVTVEQVSARLDQLRPVSAPTAPQETDFVARSQAARTLMTTLKRAAGVPSPVWIAGEMGSGRVFAAETLHRLGDPDAPFIVRDRALDQPWPNHGTVVLPNVDDLPDDLQRSLVHHLGSLPPEVRVIATAAPDGRRAVAEGRLRADLYYKLSVVLVQVPPLRQRTEDVVALFEQGLSTFAKRYNRPRPTIPPELAQRLSRHAWPGNIRELRNLAERTIVLGIESATLETVDAPTGDMPSLVEGFSLAAHLEEIEKRILEEALRQSGGDRNQAGRLLGVERNTLRYKLNKYGLLDR